MYDAKKEKKKKQFFTVNIFLFNVFAQMITWNELQNWKYCFKNKGNSKKKEKIGIKTSIKC